MSKVRTPNKKLPISHYLILAIFIGTVSFSGYLGYKKYSLKKQEITLKETILKKEATIKMFSEYEKIQEKHTAQEIFEKAQVYRINWSEPFVTIFMLENKNIEFKSLSIGKDKKVSISAVAQNYEAIALLIEEIKKDVRYENPFVGDFSESKINNQKNYNFTITFLYSEKL